ncbi:alpha/beta hydrolase [Dietzia aurantiaca]|uniref:Alpha/beta fold hydrolase n=1 Tax=Dietzia aurantiaca TaxID=983873 RepID=A0ABV9PV47_9ACTN
MGLRSRTVDIQVGQLDVLVWDAVEPLPGGQPAPTVLALHGFPESAHEWRPVAEILTRNGVRVVAPLQRGYSPGARPAEVGDYAIERLTEDVLAVAGQLELGPVHLLGHDWGASVAWWLAAHRPTALASLTAVSVPHLGAFADAVATDPDQQQRSAYFALFRQQGKAEDVLLAGGARRLREMFSGDVPEELVAEHLNVVGARPGLTGALNWYRAMRRYELPDVAVPTTFVWGDRDMAIARSGAEATASRMAADYRFVPVRGGGHWLPEQYPELISDEVLARIRRSTV